MIRSKVISYVPKVPVAKGPLVQSVSARRDDPGRDPEWMETLTTPMTLRLYNTLSGQVEELAPADGDALRMYACGPTVYDYGHIGNFRTFLQVDVLRRFLRLQGMKIRHVMNITDVDDKIIRNAAAAGVPIGDYTPLYERAFLDDSDFLRIERPEVLARATEHIPEMVDLVERLAESGAAYKTGDPVGDGAGSGSGSWYFRLAAFPEYGKLSKKDLEGITDGARVDVDEYEKDSARDFALWKATKPGETCWETAIGTGRPGWHLECSAMAMKYLGDSFDLHAGGEDLMFPHHENEIAQSESVTHKPLARHWFHVRFLLVDGRKMSKSEGNFYTLRDLLLKGYKASAIRLALISVPYRHQLNFTFEGLTEATNAIDRLRTFAARLTSAALKDGTTEALQTAAEKADAGYIAALENDLNTAEARAPIFDLVRTVNSALDAGGVLTGDRERVLAVLAKFDAVFAVIADHDAAPTKAALDWAENQGLMDRVAPELLVAQGLTDADVDALIAERNLARKQRNFKRSDEIRDELAAKGIVIEDSKDGVRWKRK